MKKIVLLFVISCLVFSVKAQQNVTAMRAADSLSPRWCFDINLKGGMQSQNFTANNFASDYLNAVNGAIGKLNYTNGMSYGFDFQLGYFFDKKRHFGIGAGMMFLLEQGDLTMDQFHIEYQSADAQSPVSQTFRQLITADGPIKETIKSSSINVPLLLKYKTQLSRKLGLGVDAGVLFNVQMRNSYSSNASFDYEAIYKFTNTGSGYVAVYDNSPSPDQVNEQFITRQQVSKESANVQAYFNNLRSQGYNVGLNQSPNHNSGTVTYTGSIGYLVQSSVSYKLSDYLSLNLGLYYFMQSLDNSANNKNYKLTDKVGSYNSLMNSVSTVQNSSYGLNLGLRIYFDKKLMDYLLFDEPLR